MTMELTSQPSHINGSTQIGNITVYQFATSMGHSMDHIIKALKETFGNTEAKGDSVATMVEPQWLLAGYDPNKYYVDLESSGSSSNHCNEICVLTLGKCTRTMFPVTISPALQINALYDTGTARSCMSYETFFTLGLDLDDKTVPRVCTTSGTDMEQSGTPLLIFK